MKERQLGKSELYVNPIGLDCREFSHAFGDSVDNATGYSYDKAVIRDWL